MIYSEKCKLSPRNLTKSAYFCNVIQKQTKPVSRHSCEEPYFLHCFIQSVSEKPVILLKAALKVL